MIQILIVLTITILAVLFWPIAVTLLGVWLAYLLIVIPALYLIAIIIAVLLPGGPSKAQRQKNAEIASRYTNQYIMDHGKRPTIKQIMTAIDNG